MSNSNQTIESCLSEIADENKQAADVLRQGVDPNMELPHKLAELNVWRLHCVRSYKTVADYLRGGEIQLREGEMSLETAGMCLRFADDLTKLLTRITCFENSLWPEGNVQSVCASFENSEVTVWDLTFMFVFIPITSLHQRLTMTKDETRL